MFTAYPEGSYCPQDVAVSGSSTGHAAPLPAIRILSRQELPLIILGIILLIIGFVAKIAIIWTIGIVVVVLGAILAVLGMAGHAVGGRRHYF
ncbi:MAG TPA: hypothetical protein VIZ43_13235 [Trebonia sp.]